MFPPWRGTFYPDDLPQKRELEYAAEHLTAIEINATYHRLQKPASFAAWAKAVPEGFVFSVKASRFITNRRELASAEEPIKRFFAQGLERLGDRLGPILWQFMPTKRFQPDDFARFLDLLPAEFGGQPMRHALEPRHESFANPAFFDLARERNIAVCLAPSNEYPCFDEKTADFTYARLRLAREDLPEGYEPKELDRWARRARGWAKSGRDTFVFFISAAKVRNPAAAQALIERLGK